MDFEDYKTKIQRVSKLIEDARYPEDLMNSKELNLEEDFQYICLNSNINNELVTEVIARLAKKGNEKIVEENIKSISLCTWKGLFNRNEQTKKLFIENFSCILDNTGIITYRDIENFIDDGDVQYIIYENIDKIIRKLCTYDRAALISNIKNKKDGIKTIKDNLVLFFQKGEFDISTTYSKVLVELGDIQEIENGEILKACSKFLGEMLDRETAIDNETNELLNWIYETFEDYNTAQDEKNAIEQDINNAIMENFDRILDKTNYDKETIKLLKLFPCTHESVCKCKNMFLENSSKLVHMTKIYDLGYEKESGVQLEEAKELHKNDKNFDEEDNTEVIKSEADENVEFVDYCANEEKSTHEQQFIDDIKSEIETIEQYSEIINQSNLKEDNTEKILEALVKSNLYETDRIINKVVNKDETMVWNGCTEQKINSDEMQNTQRFDIKNESKLAIDYGENCKEACIAIADEEKALITTEKDARINKVFKVIKMFMKKVKNLVYKSKTERIGE